MLQRKTVLRFSEALDYGGEEEPPKSYNQYRFYPVRINDIYVERYQVIRKLGFGSFSTVWLAIDLR
jgi:serine/threonine-protein kinase SRPK3